MEIIGQAIKMKCNILSKCIVKEKENYILPSGLRLLDTRILLPKMQQFCLTFSNINYIMKVDVSLGTVLKFARAIRVIIIPP